MTARKPLRAVKADETAPEPAKAHSVSSAAAEGSPRDLLVALRTRIARTMDDSTTHPRDVAPLTRQLLEVVKQIEAQDVVDAEVAKQDAGPTPDSDWEAI